MDHVVVFLDFEGYVLKWNEAAKRLFRYSASEIVGKHVSHFFTDEDCLARRPERELLEAGAQGWSDDDNWLVRGDGTQFCANGVTIAMSNGAEEVYGYAKIVTDLTAIHAAESEVRDARDRMRVALSAAKMGIWRWDIRDDVHSRDENLNRMLGLSADHPAMSLRDFIHVVHPEDRLAVADAFKRSQQGRALDIEFRIVHPDGEVRWLRDQGDVFGNFGGEPIYMTGACIDVTDRKVAEIGLQDARDQLEKRVRERTIELEAAVYSLQQEAAKRRAAQAARRELLRRVVSLQEDERQRIARELHDSVGQFVTAMNLGVKMIKESLHETGPAQEWADKLSKLTAEMSQEVHRIALELRPRSLDDISLQGALQQHLEEWLSHSKIPYELHIQGIAGRIPPKEVATTVYRVVQEALVNVAKHAKATSVSVVLEQSDDQLAVIVEDNGTGFEADRNQGVKGGTRRLGLLGMRERALLVGGSLEIESSPGAGATVYLRIPLPADSPPQVSPATQE